MGTSIRPTYALPLLLMLLYVAKSESLAIVQFSRGEYVTYEGIGIFRLIIRRSGDIEKDVVVNVILKDVSAKGNCNVTAI